MDYDADPSREGCNIKQHGDPGSFTYSVAPDWADRPVNYVSWADAARFANWMHNGQPIPKKYAVFKRDGWRCVVPGCTGYRNLQEHHVVFRSRGSALSNRVAMCAWHHLRGVHAGWMRVEGLAPEGLRFALGLRGGAAPMAAYEAGDWLAL